MTTTPALRQSDYETRVTNNPNLPPLAVIAILDLISWAEADERARTVQFPGWGDWKQGTWAEAQVADADMPEHLLDGSFHNVVEVENLIRNGVCQTAFCMAGQTVFQNGYRLQMDHEDEATHLTIFSASMCVQERLTDRVDAKGFRVWEDVPGARSVEIHEKARELLGLTEDEASRFFGGDNEVRDLKELMNGFAQDRFLPLPFPDEEVRYSVDSDYEDDDSDDDDSDDEF